MLNLKSKVLGGTETTIYFTIDVTETKDMLFQKEIMKLMPKQAPISATATSHPTAHAEGE